MKNLKWIAGGLLTLAAIVRATAQTPETAATADSFSSIELSAFADQNGVLNLTGPNVSSFESLSDNQLTNLVRVLDAMPTVPMADLPQTGKCGTFWSLHNPNLPPFPCDTSGSSVWRLSDGSYLLQDLQFDYSAASGQFSAATSMTVGAMDENGPPSLPDGTNDVSTNSYTPDLTGTGVNYGTNLFLTSVGITNKWLSALASNTIPGVSYTIQWETNLLSNNWQNAGTIVGSSLTNWTEWSIPQGSWTNLFLRLRSENSSDGTGLPDWWEALYFGTNMVNPDAQDSVGDGYTIYDKYALGIPPSTPATPPTPQGFTANYDPATGAVALSWLPSPGPVMSYTLQKTDYQSDQKLKLTLSASSTGYADSIAGDVPDPYVGPLLFVNYSLRANYPAGASPSAYAYLQFAPNPAAADVIGTQGFVSVVIPNRRLI